MQFPMANQLPVKLSNGNANGNGNESGNGNRKDKPAEHPQVVNL